MFVSDTPRVHVRVAVLAAALSLVVLAFAAMPSGAGARRGGRDCPGRNTPAARATIRELRAAVLCLMNAARNAHGLPSIRDSRRLNSSAQHWANTMVASGGLSHGSDLGARISAVGFSWSNIGETIGSGFRTPREIVNAWLASPVHCPIMLSPSYADVGIGVNRHAVAGFASHGATWDADYALPMSHRAPSGNWGPANGCPY